MIYDIFIVPLKSISLQPEISGEEGNEMIATCTAHGGRPAAKVSWVVPDELDELDLLCPPGMSWATTKARCMVNKGFTCCPTCSHEYRCSKSEGEMKCCYLLGIMPSSYKLSCRPGWVWLEWGQRCVRGDIDIG